MRKSLASSFAEFLTLLGAPAAPPDDSPGPDAILASLTERLPTVEFLPAGSYSNDTSITGFSRRDYLANVPPQHRYRDSDDLIRRMLEVVEEDISDDTFLV